MNATLSPPHPPAPAPRRKPRAVLRDRRRAGSDGSAPRSSRSFSAPRSPTSSTCAPPDTPTASTRRRAGRDEELERVLLRLDRHLQLHNRRQAARVAVGDVAVRADLRIQQPEHADPAGARGRRVGCAPLRGGAALVRLRRRSRRGSAARDHACRRPDVPPEQSRRSAGDAAGRGRVLHDARAGARQARAGSLRRAR